MSDLRVTNLRGRTAGSAPTLPDGAVVSGILTATTFSGALTGNATGLTGSPSITVTNITGVAATFSGNVSIAGTLTYEDVTNIDSVGLITARSGVKIGTSVAVASTLGTDGGAVFSGIVTSTTSDANNYEGNFVLDSYLFN